MIQKISPDTTLDKAWARIGLSPWHQMAWFVRLANTDLTKLSPGDLQNLQDECQAIRITPISFHPTRPDRKRYPFLHGWVGSLSPSFIQLQNIQAAIAPHLNRIADGQTTECGPITLQHTIKFRRSNDAQQRAGYPPYSISPTSIFNSNSWADEFLFRVTRLLEQRRRRSTLFVDSIRRCPNCQDMFVQLRRNANYCGRKCHSVAGMQKARALAKKRKQKNKRGGGSSNGKKKRH